jgi:chemotaxis protein methyltransferase CheR
MDSFPFKNTFDIIFCRNVMIYFDTAIQQSLLDKFHNVITPGGLLFIGHSESLTNKTHKLQYVQPTIYMKL